MKAICESFLLVIRGVERAVIVAGFIIMTALLLIDTLGRELVGKGFFGANIYATYALICSAMAGFGIATALGGHLRPSFMDGLVSGANERAVVRLGQFVTAALAIVIMLAAIQFVSVTIEFNETNQVVGWPLWPIQMALPVGFGVAALRHLIYGIWPDLIPTAKVTE